MAQIVNNYRYTITDRLGNLIVQPIGESDFSIEWSRDQEDGKRQYEKGFSGNIIFTGEAYQRLLSLEESVYRCERQTIKIQRRCAGDWSNWFEGEITLNEAEWDLDGCKVFVKFDESKPDACFENNKNEPINIMQATFLRRTVRMFPGNVTLETKNCQETTIIPPPPAPPTPIDIGEYWCDDGLPQDGSWVAFRHFLDRREDEIHRSTDWARQKMTISCDSTPSPDWKLLVDNCGIDGTRTYVRPATIYDCQYTYGDLDLEGGEYFELMECKIFGQAGSVTEFRNGIPLEAVINVFVSQFCPGLTVKSDFFQINPENASTTNYVTNAPSKVRNITVFQKSDIKRPGASQSATQAEWTFEGLMKTLKYMFNVDWRIIGSQFVIEHVSWYTRSIGLNLTLPKYAKFVSGKRRYTYKNEEIPRQEKWVWKEQRSWGDFTGKPIIYDNGCVTAGSKNMEKIYAIDDVVTDVDYVISNPAPDNPNVTDEGFVFVAAEYDGTNYYIITEAGILEDAKLNNSLAMAHLHRDYHKYDRPLKIGRMNDNYTEFFSSIPIKQGVTISVPLCCEDNFNPDNLVVTPLGTGVVDKATFKFKSGTIELDLLYEANSGLLPNRRPTVTNKAVVTYQNEPIVIDVLQGWSDPDPDATVLSVEIVNPPPNGTAIVLPDFTVQYTPNTGFTGNDLFTFRMRDNWGEPSNNGLVTITVRPPNQPPVANDDFYTTFKNEVLLVPAPGVFANDSDDVSFELDYYDTTGTQGGTVIIGTDGSLNYTPPNGFEGVDTFTYRIIDGKGLTDTATVSVTVADDNKPVAVTDNYTTSLDTSVSGTAGSSAIPGLLDNDYTPSGTVPLSAMPETKATAQGGSVVITSAGSFTYTPPTGFIGDDSFTYTVANAAGSSVGTANVKVIPRVYVQMVKNNVQVEPPFAAICPGGTAVGEQMRRDVWFYYFSDSAGTIPLDITDIPITLNLRERIKESEVVDWTDYDHQETAEGGVSWKYHNQYKFYESWYCDATSTVFYLETDIVLRPSSQYTII